MKSSWIHVLSTTLLLTAIAAQPLTAAPQDAPATADETDAERTEGDAEDKKFKWGLFVEVGVGSADLDALDTTLLTSSTEISINSIEFEDMEYSRAAIGWKFPNKKGSVRVNFEGFKEDGYRFSATGRLGVTAFGDTATANLDWWQLDIVDGDLTVTQSQPFWTPSDDTNMDGLIQRDEVTYPSVQFSNSVAYEPNLQNRIQTVDVVYGREWGPRRFEGVWWAGMRYFAYEGTLFQGAWLRSQADVGDGFSEGALLRPIAAAQDSTAIGPTGSLGINLNFFEERFQLFLNGQAAFVLADVNVDTGNFFTLTNGSSNDVVESGSARLTANRDRTSWHTHLDAGMRLNLKKGISFEIAFFETGYLDAVLTPTEMRIPQSAQELAQGTSAIFATQDISVGGWRSSVSFQF